MLDRARRGFTIHDPTTVDTYAGYMYMYEADQEAAKKGP